MEDNEFSTSARRRLSPKLDASEPKAAIAMLPQWKWSRHEGSLWKIRFNDRRATTRPIVTPEEIQWEQAQLKIRYPHIRSTLWNGYPNPRVSLFEAPTQVEDGQVGFGATGKPNTEPSLNSLRASELPPREMDDGVIPSSSHGSLGLCTRFPHQNCLTRTLLPPLKEHCRSTDNA